MTTQTITYGTPTTITCGVASLGTSSTFVAGRESNQVDNSSDKFVGGLLRGKITVGTTPTINTQINIYLWGSEVSAGTTALDVIDGTDSAETLTSVGVGAGFLTQAKVLQVDATTSDRTYPFLIPDVAAVFGGVMPKFWGIFVAHNTGVNLNSTGGNHEFVFTGIKYDYT